MKNRIITLSIREIKLSFKRFLSILVMSMLGVLTFVGLKNASGDMLKSLDYYFDKNNVYDIKIVSNLGIVNEDIEVLNKLSNIKNAYGAYSKDVLIKNKENEFVIKIIGLNKDVNKVMLIEGKMPKKNNEIVIEKSMKENEKYKIGDVIEIDDDSFNIKKLKIVGIVNSPVFISSFSNGSQRGITTIGNGKVKYYTYVNEDVFDINYYTESYIVLKNAKKQATNDEKYLKLVSNAKEAIDKIKEERGQVRYKQIYDEANEKIEKEKLENLEKFDDAKSKLDATNIELLNGKSKLDNTIHELNDAKEALNTYKNEINTAKEKLDDTKNNLDIYKNSLDNAKSNIDIVLSKYDLSVDLINESNNNQKINMIIQKVMDKKYYEDIINNMESIDDEGKLKLINIISSNNENKLNKINEVSFDNEDAINDISNIIDEDKENLFISVNTILFNYNENMCPNESDLCMYLNDLFGIIKLYEVIEDYNAKYNEYVINYNKYLYGLNEYNKTSDDYNTKYNEYQNAFDLCSKSIIKYNDNYGLYNKKLSEYYEARKAFEIKIEEAKEKLNDIKEPKWYIYDRLDDTSYSSYIDDSNSVSNLSKVFPTIFFVVAVLISLISMSRMVEDDRGLIGTLKSLGFSNYDIMLKYLIYSFLATVIGGLTGGILGYLILPRIIFNIYKILFVVPTFKYSYNFNNIVIGILISTFCICFTTYITVRKVVYEKPSLLLRPKAPLNGKRVIIERVKFIWDKISFSGKITIRNLLRYKRRALTIIIGIMGCTALMLVGYGIRDSIVNIPNEQYEEIFHFNDMVYLTSDYNKEDINELINNKDIKNYAITKMDLYLTKNNNTFNLVAFEDINDINKIIDLKDSKTKEKIDLDDNKVIITDKLSSLMKIKKGDHFKFHDSSNNEFDLVVTDICENYVSHYIFITKNTYEKIIDKFSPNIIYINISNINKEDKVVENIIDNDSVMSAVSSKNTISIIKDMLKSLDSVVAILIVLSLSLSIVVLYSLAYINISERKREISTLKVLGFTNREIDNYITREIIILTIIGVILGLWFGYYLTGIILKTVEIDMVRFIPHIYFKSYVITALTIITFTLIINFVIHFSLKKINMIESLKSVE